MLGKNTMAVNMEHINVGFWSIGLEKYSDTNTISTEKKYRHT